MMMTYSEVPTNYFWDGTLTTHALFCVHFAETSPSPPHQPRHALITAALKLGNNGPLNYFYKYFL